MGNGERQAEQRGIAVSGAHGGGRAARIREGGMKAREGGGCEPDDGDGPEESHPQHPWRRRIGIDIHRRAEEERRDGQIEHELQHPRRHMGADIARARSAKAERDQRENRHDVCEDGLHGEPPSSRRARGALGSLNETDARDDSGALLRRGAL